MAVEFYKNESDLLDRHIGSATLNSFDMKTTENIHPRDLHSDLKNS